MAIIQVFPGGTIQAAVDAAGSGDVVLVHDGVYNETVTISGAVNKHFIRVVARNPHRAILDSDNTLANAFILDEVNGVEINGFVIRNYFNRGIVLDADADNGNNNRIVNNRIQNTGEIGILVEGSGNLLWKNEIQQVARGIEMEEFNGNWIIQNTIRDATEETIHFDSCELCAVIGNVFYGVVELFENTNLFMNNKVFGNVQIGDSDNVLIQNEIHSANGDGILITEAEEPNTYIAENKITGCQQSGIEIPSDFNIIENNKIEHNRDSGILFNAGATGNLILRNKFDDNEPRNVTDNGVNNNYIQNDFD